MATDYKTLQPLEYTRCFLKNNVRTDGRNFWKARPACLNCGFVTTAYGSAIAKFGNMTIACGVKGEIVATKAEEPDVGFIIPNVDFPPLCSSKFKPGPPNEKSQVISQAILKLIQTSTCINLEDLCIVKGKYAWVLYCDMICLDYDGNPLDAAMTSLLAALNSVSLPKAIYDAENEKITLDPHNLQPLHLKSQPVVTTFSIIDDCIIMDPTNEEETFSQGSVSIGTLEDGSLCLMKKAGGAALNSQQLEECIQHARKRSNKIRRLIHSVKISQ